MTKLRPPVSFCQAITTIAGRIGYPECARIVARAERSVRAWGDPDTGTCPTIEQALNLDLAFVAAGGGSSPFLETFATLQDVQMNRALASGAALSVDLANAAEEFGDALSAGIMAAQPGATPIAIAHAVAETEQGQRALTRVMRRLKSFLPAGAGPVAGGIPGGTHD
jgi:hypothetical protein